MSDKSQRKNSEKKTKEPQGLGQKVNEEWNKFTKNIPDVKKEIEDVFNSVGEEIKDADLVERAKEARDKLVKVYQESINHTDVALICFSVGISVIILASAFGIMKMIC